MPKKNILHIITGLSLGGAEMMLYKLIKNSPNPQKHMVVSLTDKGYFGDKLLELNVRVIELKMSKWLFFTKIWTLVKIIKESKVDVIQCWMYHANLIGSICGFIANVKNIVWGIRHSISKHDKLSVRIIDKILALTSSFACKAVICCGDIPKLTCEKNGYSKSKLYSIYNGFETHEMYFSEEERNKLRNEFRLSNENFVIVHMARFHYLKNHSGLLKIFAQVYKKNKLARLVLAGNGIENNTKIDELIKEFNLSKSVLVLGTRTDTRAIYSMSDVAILTSLSEGFPNVLGEAMLCERPSLATDVGDCKLIIDNDDWIFDLNDNENFVKALLELSIMPKDKIMDIGRSCRKKIIDRFDIGQTYIKFHKIWDL